MREISFFSNNLYILYRYPTATINDTKHAHYINKLKIGKYPASPETPEEIVKIFENLKIKNKYGEYYKSTQLDKYAFTIFHSKNMVKRMKRSISDEREILIDATFRIVPKGPYKQLLIFYVAYKKNVCCFGIRKIHTLQY